MASKDVASMLRRFSSAATRLNADSDSANATISAIEKHLVDENVGLEVWLPQVVTSADPEGSTLEKTWAATRLGFTKLDGEWQLAVKPVRFVTGFFEGDTSCPYQEEFVAGDPVPLLKSSREIRIRALKLLPDLIEQLTEEAERCSDTIGEAKRLLA